MSGRLPWLWAGHDAETGPGANPCSLIVLTHPTAYLRYLNSLLSVCLSSNAPLLLALHPCIGACTQPAPLLTCQSTRPPYQLPSTVPSCAAPVPLSSPIPHPSLSDCPPPQPSALLVRRASLLQTVPGQLDFLVSACAVGVGCCFAAPVGGKSHFLPIRVA